MLGLLPLQGVSYPSNFPRAMPWANSSLPFQGAIGWLFSIKMNWHNERACACPCGYGLVPLFMSINSSIYGLLIELLCFCRINAVATVGLVSEFVCNRNLTCCHPVATTTIARVEAVAEVVEVELGTYRDILHDVVVE